MSTQMSDDRQYQKWLAASSSPSPIKHIPEDFRLVAFPIARPGIWGYYKDMQSSYWTPEEIDFSKDRIDYERASPAIQHFVDYIMAFFASLDKLVNVNLIERFSQEFNIFELDFAYGAQIAMENVHSETYALQLDVLIGDAGKKQRLLESVQTIPVIKKIADWVYACIDSKASMGERLIRMVCVEGLLFMGGGFCPIYWFQEQGLFKGLGVANEFISRDETLHALLALLLYTMLEPEYKIGKEKIYEIFRDAIAIATEFIEDALPVGLPMMNAKMLIEYVECQADNLITLLDLPPLYGTKNPFGFMEKLNMFGRGNFFERRITQYAKLKTRDRVEFETQSEF